MEMVQEMPAASGVGKEQDSPVQARTAAAIDHALAAQIDPAGSVVVSGFWRSGTTWLQECLAEILDAKTIFEPFHFRVPATKKLFKYYNLAKKPEPVRELFIPYCADKALAPYSLLYHYYDSALRADLGGHIVRLLRRDVAESYRPRVLVKFTRGQFSLPAAQNTFAMPVIHVYRDPRAIIASAKMTDWYWLFDHLSLKEQLLEPQDGRAQYFARWSEAIAEYDNDKVAKIAAYWAMTEIFLLHAFSHNSRRAMLVSYEELCRRPELMLEILEKLNVQKKVNTDFGAVSGDSFSTSQQRRGASSAERISGWNKVLSTAEIAMIESVAKHFGFANRLSE